MRPCWWIAWQTIAEAPNLSLQRSLEERRRNQQAAHTKDPKKQQVAINRDPTAILEQNLLEAMNGIGEGIGNRNRAQPFGEGGNWIDGRPPRGAEAGAAAAAGAAGAAGAALSVALF